MANWRSFFNKFSGKVDVRLAALVTRLRKRLGADPIQILPYHSYGTAETFYLRGRVLEDKGVRPAEDTDTIWRNLRAMYRRFESDEVSDALVQAQFQDTTIETRSDEEGYFHIEFPLMAPILPSNEHTVWHEVGLTLLEGAHAYQDTVTATAHVMVPHPESDFGIISDIDDTVLQTHATDLLKMAKVTFLNNARTRMPFAGVAAFYQALLEGPNGTSHNPLFYVSSSPWNLYDFLIDFMELQKIPVGPLFLRDFGIRANLGGGSSHLGHKLAQIERILTTYPNLPFVLIGDSGEKDPEIYREAVRHFPGRIAAIYIRDVSLDKQDDEVDRTIEQVGEHDREHGRDNGRDNGREHDSDNDREHDSDNDSDNDSGDNTVAMVFVADTVAAAEHAVEQGLIAANTLAAIRDNKQADQRAT
ncbi:MAG: phosphatase domain-containing protein [Chloroflexota bacterium]